jgi:hypothetical protein
MPKPESVGEFQRAKRIEFASSNEEHLNLLYLARAKEQQKKVIR